MQEKRERERILLDKIADIMDSFSHTQRERLAERERELKEEG